LFPDQEAKHERERERENERERERERTLERESGHVRNTFFFAFKKRKK
jgi:hypothetical protein